MAFKFYTSVAKGFKLKVRKFWGLIPRLIEVTGKKILEEGGGFLSPHKHILNRVKQAHKYARLKNNVRVHIKIIF